MANTNNSLGISNPNGETFVDYHTDPVGANNAFSAGITSGFKVRANDPASMTVLVGGESGVQDSAIVKSNSGVVYPVGNSTGDATEIEISGAPVTNSRIDSVVLSVDTTSTTSELNGYDLVSVDVVEGTVASTPSAPSDADIISAIGAGKAYIVLANITVASGVVVIIDSDISNSNYAQLGAQNIDLSTTAPRGSLATKNTTSTGKVTSTNVTCASLTISQSGTYIFVATSRAEYYSTSLQNCYFKITANNSDVSPTSGFYGGKQGDTLGQFTITALGYGTVSSGAVIRSVIRFTGSSGGFANQNSLAAIRIA